MLVIKERKEFVYTHNLLHVKNTNLGNIYSVRVPLKKNLNKIIFKKIALLKY